MMESQSAYSGVLLFAGGLALFLYGMKLLSAGLRKASGGRIASLLTSITGNPLSAMLTGAVATTAIQSSSMVMLILIGLVQSQIITFSRALGVMLGAEIGTTTMAQLLAFSISDYGLPLFAVGFFLSLLKRRKPLALAGEVLSGLGLLFFGISLMGDGVAPLSATDSFRSVLTSFDNPLLSVLAGMVMTAVIHSSGAFIAILITLAGQNVLTLEAAVPLMLGANIGTCVTAAIGSIGNFRAARRVFLAQLFFNFAGVVVFLSLLTPYLDLVRSISPPLSAGGLPRQIANAHTVANLCMALFFLPILKYFGRFLEWLLPDDPQETGRIPAVKYLRDSALSSPIIALGLARMELSRMNMILGRMANAIPAPFLGTGSGRDIIYPRLSVTEGLVMREEKLDFLEKRVTEYLIRIMKDAGDEIRIGEASALMSIVKDIEAAGDVVETLLRAFPPDEVQNGFSKEGKTEIRRLHEQLCTEIAAMTPAIAEMSATRASTVLEEGRNFDRMFYHLGFSHLKRVGRRPESDSTHNLHMELLRALELLHHLTMSTARVIVRAGGEGSQ
ncbi:MAG: Na/Pi cotransporter family protein [Chlorobiaceae bacterium]|nr:Na/Pi cotransporter family protein [Chlorobiaceae bacterium]